MSKIQIQKRQSLFHVVKNTETTTLQIALLSFLSFFFALVVGGVFLLCIGQNPFQIYGTIVHGAFRTGVAISDTITLTIPLLISSIGVLFAFKMKFWNIGAEGQIIMGAIFSAYFGIFHSDLPHGLLILLMMLAGMLGGALWAFLPALCRCKFRTNETLFTLMLNYIALYLIKYLAEGPWKDPGARGFPKIASFTANAQLDKVFGVHFGWIVALLLVVFAFVYLRYTKRGYEIAVVGESENTARYAGMNVNRIVITTMLISGAICGLGGAVHLSGEVKTLSEGIAGGIGFTAIIVAWLSRLNPYVCIIVSFLFSILEKGCGVVESTFRISAAVSDVLQGIILFSVLAFDFFINYKVVFTKGGEKK